MLPSRLPIMPVLLMHHISSCQGMIACLSANIFSRTLGSLMCGIHANTRSGARKTGSGHLIIYSLHMNTRQLQLYRITSNASITCSGRKFAWVQSQHQWTPYVNSCGRRFIPSCGFLMLVGTSCGLQPNWHDSFNFHQSPRDLHLVSLWKHSQTGSNIVEMCHWKHLFFNMPYI